MTDTTTPASPSADQVLDRVWPVRADTTPVAETAAMLAVQIVDSYERDQLRDSLAQAHMAVIDGAPWRRILDQLERIYDQARLASIVITGEERPGIAAYTAAQARAVLTAKAGQ